MKKVLLLVGGFIGVLAVLAWSGPVKADFKPGVHEEIRAEIGAFFQRNEGNKITIDVMDGLMLHLNQIFEKNVIKPPAEPKVSTIPDTKLPPRPKPNLPPKK